MANKIGASSALNQVSDKAWVRELTANLATAGSSAAISTAVNGGSLKDNLEASILSALVQTGHGYAASKIKLINGEAWYRNVAHKIAHAVAGCAAAAAGKNKCQDGAIGAAVGEIVGEALVNNTDFSGMTPEQIAKMVDDVKAQLRAQGYSVSSREVSFKNGFASGRTRPDVIARSSDNKLVIYEIKTGSSQLSIRQSEIYPQIRDGNAVPVGKVAQTFKLKPGIPLKDQGYPNGIPIVIKEFPGVK